MIPREVKKALKKEINEFAAQAAEPTYTIASKHMRLKHEAQTRRGYRSALTLLHNNRRPTRSSRSARAVGNKHCTLRAARGFSVLLGRSICTKCRWRVGRFAWLLGDVRGFRCSHSCGMKRLAVTCGCRLVNCPCS